MSQEKLGHLLGLTFQQIQKYERGINRIGAGRLFDMAHALGVGILFFYEGLIDDRSGQPLGFAEEMELAPFADRPLNNEGVQLSIAFARVTDPKARKRVLDLARTLGGADDNTRSKAKRKDRGRGKTRQQGKEPKR
jgi:transcriptional regulator with XRE-family HTH domain